MHFFLFSPRPTSKSLSRPFSSFSFQCYFLVFLSSSMPALYRHESNTEAAFRRVKTGVIGFGCGATVGGAAYFLRTQRFGKPAAGAAAFMGVVMSAGSLVRGWNLH